MVLGHVERGRGLFRLVSRIEARPQNTGLLLSGVFLDEVAGLVREGTPPEAEWSCVHIGGVRFSMPVFLSESPGSFNTLSHSRLSHKCHAELTNLTERHHTDPANQPESLRIAARYSGRRHCVK